jgi:hypothetical protein
VGLWKHYKLQVVEKQWFTCERRHNCTHMALAITKIVALTTTHLTTLQRPGEPSASRFAGVSGDMAMRRGAVFAA